MDYRDINDYELMYMIADGNSEEIEIMLEKYKPLISHQTKKWISIFKKMGMEKADLEQEIYCALILALRNYNPDKDITLYTYLLQTIEFRMKNIIRSNNTSKSYALNHAVSFMLDDQNLEEVIEDARVNVSETVDVHLLKEIIYQFCYGLSIEQGEIFELYLNGYKIHQIAKLVFLDSKRVSNLLYRIRLKLKKYLTENGYSVV